MYTLLPPNCLVSGLQELDVPVSCFAQGVVGLASFQFSQNIVLGSGAAAVQFLRTSSRVLVVVAQDEDLQGELPNSFVFELLPSTRQLTQLDDLRTQGWLILVFSAV